MEVTLSRRRPLHKLKTKPLAPVFAIVIAELCRNFGGMQTVNPSPLFAPETTGLLQNQAAATGPVLREFQAESAINMRYSTEVGNWRGKRRATHTMQIHSRRILRFLKRDYHITNLALAFLSRAGSEYLDRKQKTSAAFVLCETFIAELAGNTAKVVAERSLAAVGIERADVNFAVLSPNSVRLARLLQEADYILERLMLLELENLIPHTDRVMISNQMAHAFAAIKDAALCNVEKHVHEDDQTA